MQFRGERQSPLDWFFNDYVYGTELPSYKSECFFEVGPDGDLVMSRKLTQSGVGDKFPMIVPLSWNWRMAIFDFWAVFG